MNQLAARHFETLQEASGDCRYPGQVELPGAAPPRAAHAVSVVSAPAGRPHGAHRTLAGITAPGAASYAVARSAGIVERAWALWRTCCYCGAREAILALTGDGWRRGMHLDFCAGDPGSIPGRAPG